jgi:predicted O-linked N-acetylglucosamine transferase (SPINDLY family)
MPGGLQRGRYTLGCYRKMGFTDCVADSASHYVEIALRLANDAAYRSSIVERIRQASPRLFDDQEAVSEHERLFTLLIEKARERAS